MKNIIAQAEIVFLDAAINVMSWDKTPRVYSQTLAQLTLCLRPEKPSITWPRVKDINPIQVRQLVRLGIMALSGLAIGLLMGWLRTQI